MGSVVCRCRRHLARNQSQLSYRVNAGLVFISPQHLCSIRGNKLFHLAEKSTVVNPAYPVSHLGRMTIL